MARFSQTVGVMAFFLQLAAVGDNQRLWVAVEIVMMIPHRLREFHSRGDHRRKGTCPLVTQPRRGDANTHTQM